MPIKVMFQQILMLFLIGVVLILPPIIFFEAKKRFKMNKIVENIAFIILVVIQTYLFHNIKEIYRILTPLVFY